MTVLSPEVKTFVTNLSLSGRSRSIQATTALGKVLADRLPLPSAPVESVVTFYNNQHRIEIENTISRINEFCLLDIKQVLDAILRFYNLRYESVNPDTAIMALSKETAIVDFFKISKHIDSETIKAITDEPIQMTEYCSKFKKMMNELTCNTEEQVVNNV